jgi:hypothetical protein
MANQSKLFYLLSALAAFVISGPLTACKQTIVPSDQDMIKAFQDNRGGDEQHRSTGYLEVAQDMLAEGNQKFEVLRGKGVTYQGSDKPPVSDKTRAACQQVMGRTFCLGVKRDAGTVQFIFFEDNTFDSFRSKAIIYDKDDFKDPIWSTKASDAANARYVAIEPHWKLEYKYVKH